jgi:hypothetical protein
MWHTIKQNIIDFKTAGGKLYYEEMSHNVRVSDFAEMKLYVISRLMWDISLNVDQLCREFMRAYYGEMGWKKVYEYFILMNKHFETAPLDFGKIADSHGGCADKKHFPCEFLEECYNIFEEAVKENDKNKNSEKYAFYNDNIHTEQIVIGYLLLDLYKNEVPSDFYNQLLNNFEYYGRKKGFTYLGLNNGTFEELIVKLKK